MPDLDAVVEWYGRELEAAATRQHRQRRRRTQMTVTAILLAVGLVIAAPAVASRLGLLGRHAPPAVRHSVAQINRDAPTRQTNPHVLPATTREAMARSTPWGRVILWAARSRSGQGCFGIQFVRQGPQTNMGCGGTEPINPSIEIPGIVGLSPALLYGHISGAAKTMRITYADHTTTTTHLSDGYFLEVLPIQRTTPAARPVLLTALTPSGNITATFHLTPFWFGLDRLPAPNRRPVHHRHASKQGVT